MCLTLRSGSALSVYLLLGLTASHPLNLTVGADEGVAMDDSGAGDDEYDFNVTTMTTTEDTAGNDTGNVFVPNYSRL